MLTVVVCRYPHAYHCHSVHQVRDVHQDGAASAHLVSAPCNQKLVDCSAQVSAAMHIALRKVKIVT